MLIVAATVFGIDLIYVSLVVYWLAVIFLEPAVRTNNERRQAWIHYVLVLQEAVILTLAILLTSERGH